MGRDEISGMVQVILIQQSTEVICPGYVGTFFVLFTVKSRLLLVILQNIPVNSHVYSLSMHDFCRITHSSNGGFNNKLTFKV